jgi:hypothetical protein
MDVLLVHAMSSASLPPKEPIGVNAECTLVRAVL